MRDYIAETKNGLLIKTQRDFEVIARTKFHRVVDELNLLFKLANKNRHIKRHWIARNTLDIYNYHRRERNMRAKS
jgi:hypothetical protein